ncbi:methionine ABC transporter permease [Corynebacterium xerosis]|uniref:methionine ABC transporter permease n=1 Tax=Corynebacterium xerosis TaxID=1725 RepID=UPI00387A48C4
MRENSAFAAILPELAAATGDTVYMVSVSLLVTFVGGLILGIILYATGEHGLRPHRGINVVLGTVVNVVRSLPFVVLLIVLLGVTRLLVGTAIGPTAAIVPLSAPGVPFFARVVENALQEVPRGRIEAVTAMGATDGQVIRKVLLPESTSGLIAGATLTTVMLIGSSAMAGVVGGGGLGDMALVYGYQRFNPQVLWSCVVVLIVLVQGVQMAGDRWVRARAHKR